MSRRQCQLRHVCDEPAGDGDVFCERHGREYDGWIASIREELAVPCACGHPKGAHVLPPGPPYDRAYERCRACACPGYAAAEAPA